MGVYSKVSTVGTYTEARMLGRVSRCASSILLRFLSSSLPISLILGGPPHSTLHKLVLTDTALRAVYNNRSLLDLTIFSKESYADSSSTSNLHPNQSSEFPLPPPVVATHRPVAPTGQGRCSLCRSCSNIQKNLSEYISAHLRDSPEFTVWDRPWAPNEEARGSCCNDSEDRTELGRLRYSGEPVAERVKKNPILQVESRGGGLFELDWKDRAKLLRQLVDWQCEFRVGHSEPG